MTMIRKIISILPAAAGLWACAAAPSSVQVGSEASGSPYFSLGPPGVYKAGDGLRLVGRVCRRSRTTLLSPARVRIEHVAASGDVAEVAHAGVAAIYRNADQACASYAARVGWRIADGESLRACFDRVGACPRQAAVKAVVAVPAASGSSP
jgi:hypothetical protein